jgi:hypothetical protein
MRHVSWMCPYLIALGLALPIATRADAPAKPPQPAVGVFTVKAIVGINPTKDQIRAGESGDWKLAFAKCPEADHQPPLRVGDSRLTTTKEKQGPSGALVDVTTLEMDFECGSCGGKTCPYPQYCVETAGTASCEAALPSSTVSSCTPATGYSTADRHVRCAPLAGAAASTTCPKVGSPCAKAGDTCGARDAAKASSFSNFMRCEHGKWQSVEVPPPPPP